MTLFSERVFEIDRYKELSLLIVSAVPPSHPYLGVGQGQRGSNMISASSRTILADSL